MRSSLFFYLLVALSCSCGSNIKEQSPESSSSVISFDYSSFTLKAGDLLFQDIDCGPFCESIEKVTSGVEGSNFSHVGMVIPSEKGGLVVLEAVSAGVLETPLDTFFNRSFDDEHNSKVVVGRMKEAHQHLIPKAIEFAKTKMGYPYDDVFDIANEKYYCSELIYFSFAHANSNQPIFQLQAMTYKDPETNNLFPIWKDYFKELNVPVPEGEPGLNPGGMSKSDYIDIVHFYGKPQGYKGA